MSDNLGRKLAETRTPVLRAGGFPAEKELCLVVDERWGFSCEFHDIEGAIWVLPYHRLTTLEADSQGQRLMIAFTSHEVVIVGKNLSKIRDAMGRSRNLVVRPADARQKGQYCGDDVLVSDVRITERNDPPGPIGAAGKQDRPAHPVD